MLRMGYYQGINSESFIGFLLELYDIGSIINNESAEVKNNDNINKRQVCTASFD